MIGKKLGEGAYAVVHTALNKKTNDRCAMKIYDKEKVLTSQSRKRSVSREIQVMRRVNHPNIVKFHETIDTKKSLNLVMEHVEGISLYEYVKRRNLPGRFLPEDEVRGVIQQIVQAISYLHKINIAHRDIKLDNIIINNDLVRQLHRYQNNNGKTPEESLEEDKTLVIKLIDFGFSITCDKKSRQFCGTPSYMAPEIVKKIDYEAKGTDIWAVGVLLYRMLYGDPPFKAPSEKELY